jgi:Integrase core domain
MAAAKNILNGIDASPEELRTPARAADVRHRLLYGFVVLQHSRRELLWLGVTARPNADWIVRQLTEAYGWQQTPRYIVRDRDGVYGDVVLQRLRAMGIRDRPISPRSPWQNGYSERLIGSIRRDCLDHVVVFGERHLRHLLKSYQKYYNEARTHLSLQKDAPTPRAVQTVGHMLAMPVLADCITLLRVFPGSKRIIPKLEDPDSCYVRRHWDIHCKNVRRSNGIWAPCSGADDVADESMSPQFGIRTYLKIA